MGEAKPTASLSGLLLARKGAARPAMRRPSMFGSNGNLAVSQDDLGWNDMGYDVDPDPTAPMDYEHDTGFNALAGAVPEVKPEVRQQQERIAEQLQVQFDAGFEALYNEETTSTEDSRFEENVRPEVVVAMTPMVRLKPSIAEVAAKQVDVVTAKPVAEVAAKQGVKAPKKRAAAVSKAKAAFTLRLDNERHLKLRLACAVSNRSAQMIVTEALDAFLNSIPEIEQLAARVAGR